MWEYKINLATLTCLEIMPPEIIKFQRCQYFPLDLFPLLEFSQNNLAAKFGMKYLFISCPLIFQSDFTLM